MCSTCDHVDCSGGGNATGIGAGVAHERVATVDRRVDTIDELDAADNTACDDASAAEARRDRWRAGRVSQAARWSGSVVMSACLLWKVVDQVKVHPGRHRVRRGCGGRR